MTQKTPAWLPLNSSGHETSLWIRKKIRGGATFCGETPSKWAANEMGTAVAQLFLSELRQYSIHTPPRRWVFVPYDQLSHHIGPLGQSKPGEVGIILCESLWKGRRRRYHKQKLAIILSNQRHFALEQARRGVPVRYLMGRDCYRTQLSMVVEELGPLTAMQPAERELRQNLRPLVSAGLLTYVHHEGWLTQPDDFYRATQGKKHWRMDAFYRYVRTRYGYLMEPDGKPSGGKWSHDDDNRHPWKNGPPAPTALKFEVHPVTAEVCDFVEKTFSDHPGVLAPDCIPATADDAQAQWIWAKKHCLTHFGRYEDAMSVHEPYLFHTRISVLLNLHRLLPKTVVDEVADLEIPINSKEGFIRQVLGWREFCAHIHRETDGFNQLPEELQIAKSAGPSFLEAHHPLPPVFWGRESGLKCLDHVVKEVWELGYSHHINRLMVLSNWATLLGIEPQAVSDWFWVGFEDAFDWVVEPNVLGMGTFALGELMVTKPYVSGSAYISKMSDYCDNCQFDAKKNCPMTSLYWQFIARHKKRLSKNPRMRVMLSMLERRSPEKKEQDARTYRTVVERLDAGHSLSPELFVLEP